MELKEIVKDWLIQRGLDGLCDYDCECACGIDDLMPCDQPGTMCMAAFKEDADPSTGYDFMIEPGGQGGRRYASN